MSAGPAAPIPAFRLQAGGGDRWLALFLSRLAERLGCSPCGEVVLIEQWWDGRQGGVHLLPFSRRLAVQIDALAAGTPLRWSSVPHELPPGPPPGRPSMWVRVVEARGASPVEDRSGESWVLSSGGRPPDRGGRPTRLDDVLLEGDLLPPGRGYWAAVQTHWGVGADRRAWSRMRGRFSAGTREELHALRAALEARLRRLAGTDGPPFLAVRVGRPWLRGERAWRVGAASLGGDGPALPLGPGLVRAAIPYPLPLDPSDDPRLRHVVVLGASGSGKTAALAQLARAAMAERRSVVLFDVHGDLAPQVVSGISAHGRDRLVGIDIVDRPDKVPGLSVFGPVPACDREPLIAHLVAAFKRLSTENGETFWGFRLERVFETFLRIVQEQGGDLVDLWGLLTDPRRREAARLSTPRPELARFLDELEGIVRRQPEFLWSAASRVAKVVGSPLLTALLAPKERPADLSPALGEGGSVIWRLPMGELGPEGVTFAVTLLLTRVYLDQVRRAGARGPSPELRLLFVLDEAHLFPSRLLSEIVAEGRKFGLGLVAATQYPARLAPELRDALTGAAGTVFLFRVPWASAGPTGAWAGLAPDTADQILPSLPAGWAVVASTGPNADRRLTAMPPPAPSDLPGWRDLVRECAERFGSPVPYPDVSRSADTDWLEEELLLGLVALGAEGRSPTRSRLLRWVGEGEGTDPVLALPVLDALVHRGWAETRGDDLHLTTAGAERAGLTARTGARPESAEHRALLVAALRIFARHHERLEILRQGRFDTRLPDGRVSVLPPGHRSWGPAEMARYLDRRRRDWVWRAFGGRDVQVEAEVSGATRRERVERDWAKARDAGASLLVLVSDDARAATVRRFLRRAGAPPYRATVWTLRSARAVAHLSSAT